MTQPRFTVFLVAGARPNFMKIAPLCRALGPHAEAIDPIIVHTGQHYDYTMSQVFFEQLEIPQPHHHLDVGSGSHAYQTAQVMVRFEALVLRQRPDLVVVVGDVNSTIAAALTAAKLHIPVAHVEAGLRSFDMRMPEEVNRILTDRLSTLLFATEPAAVTNLRREGATDKRIRLVGNVMIDELVHNLPRIRARDAAQRLGLVNRPYGLVTLHRPANVDTAEALRAALDVLGQAAERGLVVFPVHPRTARNIDALGLRAELAAIENLRCIEPLGYLDFMNLLSAARYILTDSGGIQVEAAWLGVPCVTLRTVTEHVCTVEGGYNRLVGLDASAIADGLAWAEQLDRARREQPAIWDGKAAERIALILREFLEAASMPRGESAD